MVQLPEQISELQSLLGVLPVWAWVIIGLFGLGLAIKIIKKAVGLGIALIVISIILSSSGISSRISIEKLNEIHNKVQSEIHR